MEKQLKEYKYWLLLGRNVRFTASLFFEIHALKIPIEEIIQLSETQLISLGLSQRCVRELIRARDSYTVEKVLSEMNNNHIEAIFYFEADYPEILRQIYDPPFILYKKGEANLNKLCVGVVGSRRLTDYGVQATGKIVSELADTGITIVSGLALGVDSVAHEACLSAGGVTISVLGCGLNQIYPSRNLGLARNILASGGAIISEYPFDTRPAKQNFPARNRIISGLSVGLVVTEAAEKSGSLITAYAALEQNREVFAVSGNIFSPSSVGTNNLIRSGAHMCTSGKDVLDELGIVCPEAVACAREVTASTEEEGTIIECLTSGPMHIDAITKSTGLPQSSVGSTLTLMELTAKVKHMGGNVFRLNN